MGALTRRRRARPPRLWAASYPWIVRVCGGLGLLGGGVSVVGLALPTLPTVLALALSALGAGMVVATLGARALARGLGLLTATIGLALVGARVGGGVLGGGVMPVAAGSSVLLGGVALLCLVSESPRAAAIGQALSLGVVGLAGSALVANAYGAATVLELWPGTTLVPIGAVLFLVEAVGLLFLRADRGPIGVVTRADDLGGLVARRLLPIALLLPFGLGLLWRIGADAGWWLPTLGLTVVIVAGTLLLTALVWWSALLVHRIDTAWRKGEEEQERARAEAERRALEEEALRVATQAVTGAFTVEEILDRIVQSALKATRADSSMIERIDDAREEAEVVAVAGVRRLPVATRVPYAGSLAQQVVGGGEPLHILDMASDARVPAHLSNSCRRCSALAVPMTDPGGAVGALLLIREREHPVFSEAETRRAMTFADLASLAFRKVQLLEEAERQRDELSRVLERQARLVRGFSHDVKNPLGAADGRLALFEEGLVGELTEKQAENVAKARRSIGTALRLIDSLVEFARTEAGQIPVRPTTVDAARLVGDVVEEQRPAAGAKEIALEFEDGSEPVTLETDPDRLQQILGNLISNAIKYTDEGSVTVRLRANLRAGGSDDRSGGSDDRAGGSDLRAGGSDVRADGVEGEVLIDVEDTGRGIPEDRREDVFEEFTRVGDGEGRGAGLGLAISRRLARLLGGDITLESELGRGSTFTLRLPRRRVGADGQPSSGRAEPVR